MWPFGKKKSEQRARDKPARAGRRELRLLSRPRADNTLQGNEAIYAAVSRIANTLASVPIHVYRENQRQNDHPLERLMSLEPNPNMSPFTFKQTVEVYRNTEGTAYVLIVRDGLGGIKRLDILNPTRVRPAKDPTDGSIWYMVRLDDENEYQVPGYMVLCLKHMSANGVTGIRPIDVLRSSLDYDRQVKALGLDQLDGVNHGVMLTVPNAGLTDEQKDALVDDFLATYEQSNRSVIVLEGGMTATTFSSSPVDSHLLDVERITRNRVATVYNLPPHMLGDYTDTSFSTAQQQYQEFLQLTMIPIVQQWEDEMNRKLLLPQDWANGLRIAFDTDAMIRADVVAMANKHQMAIRGGWMRPNEVREREHRPPDPYGDKLMVARDMIPLEVAVEHPELLLSGKSAEPSDGNSEKGGNK